MKYSQVVKASGFDLDMQRFESFYFKAYNTYFSCGDNGTRTRNRMLAKHVFYQLKYIPGEIILNYIKKINKFL